MLAQLTGTCSSQLGLLRKLWTLNRTESTNCTTGQCFWISLVKAKNTQSLRRYKLMLDISDPVAEATDLIPKIPYYLCCNRERFPYWFGQPDRRNGDFLNKIKQFKQQKGFSVQNKCPFLFNLAYVTVNVTSFGAVFTCPDDS